MRVVKKMGRKALQAPPAVSAFMEQVMAAEEKDLAPLLQQFNKWTFPKGDLFQWVAVLDKCDAILERQCRKYALEKVQVKPFEAEDRALLVAILSFTAFLLDHCANRSLYSSANNITELLNATDIDVTEQTCRVTVRLAHRHNQQRNHKTFGISQERILRLATSLQTATKDCGVMHIPMSKVLDEAVPVADAWRALHFWYYKQQQAQDAKQGDAVKSGDYFTLKTPAAVVSRQQQPGPQGVPSTPTPGHVAGRGRAAQTPNTPATPGEALVSQTERTGEGMSLIQISAEVLQTNTLEELLTTTLAQHALPVSYHFELMVRMRLAKAANESRERLAQLVSIRALAVAALAFTVAEPVLQARLFAGEGDLIPQLATLVNPDFGCSEGKIAALNALEAIAHHRPKLSDVLAVLGASVNHGLIIYIVKRTLADLQHEVPKCSSEYVEAVTNLLHYLSTTNLAGSMLCSAGLVQLLVQLLETRQPAALRAVVKSLTLLDHLLYGFPQSFQIFCNADGPSILVERIRTEILTDLEAAPDYAETCHAAKVDYQMPHERFSLLKTMLKTLLHMMQSTGTADGLRNLIETSLLASLNLIFENTTVFGSSVFASATNIMATFIHNEPTSYQILHEKKVPETFLRSISKTILPASDAMTAIPNALGAIGLNAQGMALFDELKPIEALFNVLALQPHCEALQDSDSGGILGGAIDELVRHHPVLKTAVSTNLLSTMDKILDIGRRSVDQTELACVCRTEGWHSSSATETSPENITDTTEDEHRLKRPVITLYIDALARFLEGLFSSAVHVREFITNQGLEKLIGLYELDCLPYDFARTNAALALSHVFRVASEINSHATLGLIFDKTTRALEVFFDSESGLQPQEMKIQFDAQPTSDMSRETTLICQLRKCHSYAVLLSDLYALPVFNHNRGASTFYQALADGGNAGKLLHNLGRFYRHVLWTEISMAERMSPNWVRATRPHDDGIIQPVQESAPDFGLSEEERASPKFANIKTSRFLLCQLPPCIIPFFQGVSKMLFNSRRTLEAAPRAVSVHVAQKLAAVLTDLFEGLDIQTGEEKVKQSYLDMNLNFAHLILCDERNPANLTTCILMHFEKGVGIIIDLQRQAWERLNGLDFQLTDVTQNVDKPVVEQAKLLQSIIQMTLQLCLQFTSHRAMLDSQQTQALIKERDPEKPGYFEPHAFLRKMRMRILPAVRAIFESEVNSKILTGDLRTVIVILTQCVSAEGESASQRDGHNINGIGFLATNQPHLGLAPPTAQHRSPILHEQNVLRLASLGYSEAVARSALDNANDDLPTAMDYLVAHPELATGQSGDPQASGSITAATKALTELDKTRQELASLSIMQAVDVLETHPDVVFELSALILASLAMSANDDWVSEGVNILIGTLESMDGGKSDPRTAAHLGAVTHLLAKLSHSIVFMRKAFEDLVESQETILKLLADSTEPEKKPWIASAILILDAMLAQSDGPHPLNVAPHTSLSTEQVDTIFDACMTLLKQKPNDKSIILSLCRFFVRLTRKRDLGARFLSQGGLAEFFAMLKQTIARTDENIRTTVIILLRHFIETDEIILQTMEAELTSWFKQPKARNTEISNFVKQNAVIALRDPELFIRATDRLCCFPKYDESANLQVIALRELAYANMPSLQPEKREPNDIKEKPVEVISCLLNELHASRERFKIEHQNDSKPASSTETPKTPFRSAEHPEYLYRCLILQCLSELLAAYTSCKLEFINFTRKPAKDAATPGKPRAAVLNFLVMDLLSNADINMADDLASKKRYAVENWTRAAIVSLCSSVQQPDDGKDETLIHIRKVVLDVLTKVIRDIVNSHETADVRYAKIVSLSELLYRLMTPNAIAQGQLAPSAPPESAWHTAKLMIEKDFVSLLSSILADIDLQHPSARKVVKAVLKPLKTLTKISVRLSETTELAKPIADQGTTEAGDEAANFFEESSSESSDGSGEENREDAPDLYRNSALGLFGGDMQAESENSSYGSNEEEEMYDEMDFDDEGSETGSAVSDEELEMSDGAAVGHDMDIELVLDGDHMDHDDESGSGEDHSDYDEDEYSDSMDAEEIEIIEEDGFDEGEWQDEDDDGQDIDGDAHQMPGDQLMLELGGAVNMTAADLEAAHNTPDDAEDEDNEEYEEGMSQEDEDPLEDDDDAEYGDEWAWAVEDEDEGGAQRQSSGRGIANRLWASLSAGPPGAARDAFDPDVQVFRRPRYAVGGATGRNGMTTDQPVLSNPLLSATADVPGAGSAGRRPRGESNFSNWVESIEALMGGGAVQLIGDMLQRPQGNQRGAQAIRVEMAGPTLTALPTNARELDRVLQETGQLERLLQAPSAMPAGRTGSGVPQRSTAANGSAETQREEDPMLTISFVCASTLKRWQDDATITFDGSSVELALRLVSRLLQAMSPRAKAEAAERKVVEERERLEKLRIAEQEQSKREKEDQEREAEAERLRLEKEKKETEERAQAAAEAPPSHPDTMEGVQATGAPSGGTATRQVITIRGQDVDITGLGIDVEFLNALPSDMQEEVLTQHIRERRAAAQETLQPAVELTPEFLEALPAEIRAELIQQETVERRRRERLARQAQAQAATGAPAGPTEMDPASFLASLDPALRQQVLMEMDQDDDLFNSLPPHLLAGLEQLRAMPRDMVRIRASRGAQAAPTAATADTVRAGEETTAETPKVKREAIQLLDKNGVAGFLRLIFLPLSQQKSLVHEVLQNLCENRQNRAEVVSHLLLILQDGSLDMQSAERCFNLMTKRSRQLNTETPMKTPKKTIAPFVSLPIIIGENAPQLIALQSLQALSYLVHYNGQLPSFFLTEHDSLAARRNAKAKGKGKEVATKASRFPINSLFSLLDRDIILNTSEILEQLSHLLGVVTRPLLILKKRQKLQKQESENVEMTDAQGTTQAPEVDHASGQSASTIKVPAESPESDSKNKKALVPPDIPHENLRLVVNILRANECSSRTFQNTLATMQHLGALPDAKQVIADELVSQAQALGNEIQAQLLTLLEHIRSLGPAQELQSFSFASFSSGSSGQAKLLRMLKSIDYLFESRQAEGAQLTAEQQEQAAFIAKLYDSLNFGQLWTELSDCLTVIHEASNMIHVATILLPLIEALMVVCKQIAVGQTSNKEAKASPGSRQATPATGDSLSAQFFNFTEQHRKILNQMVRNNPALMSGSFSLLVKNPKVLEFDNKRNYFVRKLHDKASKEHYRPLTLNVRRDMIFLDSYKNLHFKSGDEIKYAKLNIRFAGEEGVDAGGVTREWFQVLARQMFDPNYALFVPVNADRNTYHPNKLSGVNPEHLSFFKFVGRIVGKALYDGRLLDCHFSRPVYRKMLGKNVALKDMETLDLEYYKSLQWMLENDITDVITETFSVERDDFGELTIIDLIPNGREIAVTEENKQEYVARVTQYRLLDSVSEQLDHFMKGFNDVIPPELVSIFNEQEIELLISGLPDIDTDDWRNNTDYHNYTASSPQILWFWRAVRSFDDEERARLLQFATGSSRIPIEGFAHLEGMQGVQKFNIHRDYTNGDRLPQSHTCFNQLDLPEYESYEALRSALLTAISEGNEGFGFA